MCSMILCLQSLTTGPETTVLRPKETSVQTRMRHGELDTDNGERGVFSSTEVSLLLSNIPKNDFTNSQASGISFYNCFGLNGAIENLVLLIQISNLLMIFTLLLKATGKKIWHFHHSVKLTTLPFQSRGRSCHSVLFAPVCVLFVSMDKAMTFSKICEPNSKLIWK